MTEMRVRVTPTPQPLPLTLAPPTYPLTSAHAQYPPIVQRSAHIYFLSASEWSNIGPYPRLIRVSGRTLDHTLGWYEWAWESVWRARVMRLCTPGRRKGAGGSTIAKTRWPPSPTSLATSECAPYTPVSHKITKTITNEISEWGVMQSDRNRLANQIKTCAVKYVYMYI